MEPLHGMRSLPFWWRWLNNTSDLCSMHCSLVVFPQYSGRYTHEGQARAGSLLDRTEVKIRVNKASLKADHASIRITKLLDICFSFWSCVTVHRCSLADSPNSSYETDYIIYQILVFFFGITWYQWHCLLNCCVYNTYWWYAIKLSLSPVKF